MTSKLCCLSVSILGLLCLLCLINEADSAVISIDFSSEWIKVALVKPGVPMEIVLNKESKRKTAAIVALRTEERLFSDPAMSTAVKYPKSAYQYLQFIAGLQYDNPLVKKYQEWFPYYDITKDETRNTLVFKHSEDLSFTTEELIAMLLNNSRELAQEYAGVPIKNAIITIPSFYSQAQRRAILSAAQLVDLNVLQLMTDSAAVALNYGVFRRDSFNSSATYMMFFDMGATSTTVSVVEYKKVQVKESGTSHIVPQLAIKGIGFDRTLGGLEMDMRLRDHLAKTFTANYKTKTPVYDSPRAMAKLLKEARRVKMVLSANVDIVARIEGLHEDMDFSVKVTRVQFEEMCADLFDRIEEPVKQALKISEITLDEIETVMLVGGGTRVPKVQEKLLKAIKRRELGKNLNTDEAAALGSVYQAAALSKLFRVKKFIVKEASPYPIQVSFDKLITDDDGIPSTKTVTRTLFNVGNPYPQKKILTFNKYNQDFNFSVFYGKIDYLSEQHQSYIGTLNLSSITLDGVMKALEDNANDEPSGVKAHFRMEESGLLLLESVQSHFEREIKEEPSTFSKITSAFSNLFGGSENEETDEEKGETDKQQQEHQEETTDKRAEDKEKEDKAEEPSENKEEDEEEEEDANGKKQDEDNYGEEQVKDTNGDDANGEEQDTNGEEQDINGEEQVEDTNGGDANGDDATGEEQDTNGEEQDTNGEEQDINGEEQDEDADREEQFVEEEFEEEQSIDDTEEIPDIDNDENKEDTPEVPESNSADEDDPSSDEGTTSSSSEPKETLPSDSSSSNDTVPVKKQKEMTPKTVTVKVNITANVVQLDLNNMTEKEIETSTTKLKWFQQRDEDKRQNELIKNNLESHIFEFTEFMYTEQTALYATEQEKKDIIESLQKAAEWLEEDGFNEETDVYKQKLRELKRVSRPLVRRLDEASKRPKAFYDMYSSINISIEFLFRMKNLSSLEIFTEVEYNTLLELTKETKDWLLDAETKQNATQLFEDPAILSSEIDEKVRKLDREIGYLINKLKNYRPKKPKTTNATNTTTTPDTAQTKNNSTKKKEKVVMEDTEEQLKKEDNEKEEIKEDNSDKSEKEEETLALPSPTEEEEQSTTATSDESRTEL